jgi:hypothetical protein
VAEKLSGGMSSLWRYNFVLYISIDHTEVDAIIRERSERGRKEKEMEKICSVTVAVIPKGQADMDHSRRV